MIRKDEKSFQRTKTELIMNHTVEIKRKNRIEKVEEKPKLESSGMKKNREKKVIFTNEAFSNPADVSQRLGSITQNLDTNAKIHKDNSHVQSLNVENLSITDMQKMKSGKQIEKKNEGSKLKEKKSNRERPNEVVKGKEISVCLDKKNSDKKISRHSKIYPASPKKTSRKTGSVLQSNESNSLKTKFKDILYEKRDKNARGKSDRFLTTKQRHCEREIRGRTLSKLPRNYRFHNRSNTSSSEDEDISTLKFKKISKKGLYSNGRRSNIPEKVAKKVELEKDCKGECESKCSMI